MIAQELINDMIPPLKMSDKAKKALGWMEELRIAQLPVVHDGAFLGFVSEEMLFETNDGDRLIGNLKLAYQHCAVANFQHFFDIIKMATDNDLEVIAVLDENKNYLGSVSLNETLTAFSQTATIQSPGGILVLSIDGYDYSMAEIARLIEADNARILGSSITNDANDSSIMKLTIKLNKTDLSRIIATLERFGYRVDGRFQEESSISNDKERLDILLKYLNI